MWQVAPRMGAVEEEAMDNKAIKEEYPVLDCLERISLATCFYLYMKIFTENMCPYF